MTKVGVVGVPGAWSSEKMADALEARTGFRLLVDLARVRVDLESGSVYAGDEDLGRLDGLVVKKVGPSYSPRLLDRLEMLRYIARRGPRIFSPPENISALLSRLGCTVTLARAGIPMPPTIVTEDPDEAVGAVRRFGRAVLKPLYTSKARGMTVVEDGPMVREEIDNYKDSGNSILYVQKMLDLPGKDLGLVFLGGRYLATYARVKQNNAWNTTTASGGRYEAHDPPPEIIELARKAQDLFGLDFTSVDVAETSVGPVVFEVSAFGGFRGLQEGCGLDAAREYARYVVEELES